MGEGSDPKILHSVTIDLGASEGKIEKLPPQENEPAKIRISSWDQGHLRLSPLDIAENELINLLEKAIRAAFCRPDL